MPWFQGPAATYAESDVVAVDCEMVGIAGVGYDPCDKDTAESAVCRVSLVRGSEELGFEVCLDTWVDVPAKIVDFRTDITGIDSDIYARLPRASFLDVRELVLANIQGKILVGHALWNDFRALRINHPGHLVRDTALNSKLRPPWRRSSLPSLDLLVRHWLGMEIRIGGVHDSVEDAMAALKLYQLHQVEWEENVTPGSSVQRAQYWVEDASSVLAYSPWVSPAAAAPWPTVARGYSSIWTGVDGAWRPGHQMPLSYPEVRQYFVH